MDAIRNIQRTDTLINWQTTNPHLANGEIVGVDMGDGTQKTKMGNILGDAFNDLPYQEIAGPKGDTGVKGDTGLSAFEIWKAHNNLPDATTADYLLSLKGEQGMSAYQIWLANGYVGSEIDYLVSLVGPKGEKGTDGILGKDGKSAYQSYLDTTNDNPKKTEAQWSAQAIGAKGDTGKSAYEIWLEAGNVGSVEDYLAYNKGDDGIIGEDGADGKSAYQSYLDTTLDNPKKTEVQWLASLKGESGVATADATTATKGIVKLSVAPAVASEPIAVGTNDTRLIPTHTEAFHLGPDLGTDSGWIEILGSISSVDVVITNTVNNTSYAPSATFVYTYETKATGGGTISSTTSLATFSANMVALGANSGSVSMFRISINNLPVWVNVKVIVTRKS